MIKRKQNSSLIILLTTAMMIILSSPVRADTHNYYWYYVEWGDTLSELSETYYQDIETVAEINNIENIDLIYAESYLQFIQNLKKDPTTTIDEYQDNKSKNRDKSVENKKTKNNEIERVRNMVEENPYHVSFLGGN